MLLQPSLLVSVLAALAVDALPHPQRGSASNSNTNSINEALSDLAKIPNLDKYVRNYTDFSNLAKFPFIAPIPNGPAPTGCTKYEVVIARGTGELGPFGFIIGDPLMLAIQKRLPEARGYALQYPANFPPSSWQTGVKETVKYLNNQNKACPSQKFAIVGYSQGAMVMHLAFNNKEERVSASVVKQIVGGAMFGDPAPPPGSKGVTGSLPLPAGIPDLALLPFPGDLNAKVKIHCATADPVCTKGSLNFIKHLLYNNPSNAFISDSAKLIVDYFKQ